MEIEAAPRGRHAYTDSRLTAAPGRVTIIFRNPQWIGLAVKLENPSGKIVMETQRIVEDETSAPVRLAPGTYSFFSPGFRKAGMEGTLRVW